MHRMDVSIERFVNGRLSRRGLVRSAAALGLSGAALQALQAALRNDPHNALALRN